MIVHILYIRMHSEDEVVGLLYYRPTRTTSLELLLCKRPEIVIDHNKFTKMVLTPRRFYETVAWASSSIVKQPANTYF